MSWSALLRWRYESSPDGRLRRDLRIDLLRGFCVFAMTVDHVGGESSWLYVLTGADRFIVSAAEIFVLVSGYLMGVVYRSVLSRGGVEAMLKKAVARLALLYPVAVALTLTFAPVSLALGAPWATTMTPSGSGVAFVLDVLLLRRSYPLTDVMVLYTLLVLGAVPLLWLLARGWWKVALGLSWTAYAVGQLWPGGVPQAWRIVDGGFPFVVWQIMFYTGLVSGFERARFADHLRPSRLAAIGTGLVIAVAAVTALLGPSVTTLLFDKNTAGIGRVTALFGLVGIAIAFITIFWQPVRRATGWLLLPLGRRPLFAYAVQLFVVALFASTFVAPYRLHRENALFQAAAVAVVWLACLVEPRVRAAVSSGRADRLTHPAVWTGRLALAGVIAVGTLSSALDSRAPAMPSPEVAVPDIAVAASVGGAPAGGAAASTPAPGPTSVPAVRAPDQPGRLAQGAFWSAVLGRTMEYAIYLPPGYDSGPRIRYPTLYLLHGGSGDLLEWESYGVLDVAERLMRSGAIQPMLIVMPEGDQEYWVDHVKSAIDGDERWGTYTATEVVRTIDTQYRTIPNRAARAIGGLSMGGHGAMQLALNFPGIWSAVGAHSPALRPEGDAPSYLGQGADFAARDPLELILAKPALARAYRWWIDAADTDPWVSEVARLDTELSSLGAAHEVHVFPGDHSAAYWEAHAEDYLRFYSAALRRG